MWMSAWTGIRAGRCHAAGLSDVIRRDMCHPLCAWAGVSIYAGIAEASAPQSEAPVVVERSHKSDRVTHPFNVVGAECRWSRLKLPGGPMRPSPFGIATGACCTRLTRRTTGHRQAHDGANAPRSDIDAGYGRPGKVGIVVAFRRELPDGCEGAFSPYAAPRMAHVIGRRVSRAGETRADDLGVHSPARLH